MKKYFSFLPFFILAAIISCSNATSQDSDKGNGKSLAPSEKSSLVKKINTAIFKEKIFDFDVHKDWKFSGDKPCIGDFYADWCAPCRMIAPILDELSIKYEGKIDIYKVNIDYEKALAGAFGISSIPAVLFCPKDGKPSMANGALPKEDYEKAINEVLLIK